MPNSFRKRLKKVMLESNLSPEEVQKVLNAIDKQKPLPRIEPKDRFFIWACPNCETDFIESENDNYCPVCGQALSGSEMIKYEKTAEERETK